MASRVPADRDPIDESAEELYIVCPHCYSTDVFHAATRCPHCGQPIRHGARYWAVVIGAGIIAILAGWWIAALLTGSYG